MKKINRTIIISLIIALGLITRPLWKKIFRKPMEALVIFSDKTKIAWFVFIPAFFLLIYIIKYWKGYILFCKNKKQKDFIKKKKEYLFVALFLTAGVIFIFVVAIITQIVIVTKGIKY